MARGAYPGSARPESGAGAAGVSGASKPIPLEKPSIVLILANCSLCPPLQNHSRPTCVLGCTRCCASFFPLRCYLSILDDGGYHEVFRGCSPDKSTLPDRCRPRRPVYL